MRAEDQLKDEEAEELQDIVQGLEEGHDDERAEEKAVEELPAAARHFQQVVATMHSVLEGVDIDFEQIPELAREERDALELLSQAVQAKGRGGKFIYAEHRLEQLNQALALLQPALSIASAPGLEDVRGELSVVIDEVETLRDKLVDLEAAEEEHEARPEEQKAEGDKDDDDDDEGDEGADEFVAGLEDLPGRRRRAAAASAGAPAAERGSTPSTLTGTPEVPDLPVRPTTLVGTPEAPDFEPPPSTLGDAEDAPQPSPGGPAADAAAKPARSRKAT